MVRGNVVGREGISKVEREQGLLYKDVQGKCCIIKVCWLLGSHVASIEYCRILGGIGMMWEGGIAIVST